jgi:hypothetical protein
MQASEAIIRAAIEAGSTASGVTLTAATPDAGLRALWATTSATCSCRRSGCSSRRRSQLVARAERHDRPADRARLRAPQQRQRRARRRSRGRRGAAHGRPVSGARQRAPAPASAASRSSAARLTSRSSSRPHVVPVRPGRRSAVGRSDRPVGLPGGRHPARLAQGHRRLTLAPRHAPCRASQAGRPANEGRMADMATLTGREAAAEDHRHDRRRLPVALIDDLSDYDRRNTSARRDAGRRADDVVDTAAGPSSRAARRPNRHVAAGSRPRRPARHGRHVHARSRGDSSCCGRPALSGARHAGDLDRHPGHRTAAYATRSTARAWWAIGPATRPRGSQRVADRRGRRRVPVAPRRRVGRHRRRGRLGGRLVAYFGWGSPQRKTLLRAPRAARGSADVPNWARSRPRSPRATRACGDAGGPRHPQLERGEPAERHRRDAVRACVPDAGSPRRRATARGSSRRTGSCGCTTTRRRRRPRARHVAQLEAG